MINDRDIDVVRIAGDIVLVLKSGTVKEAASLLDVIERVCGIAERLRIESWISHGMPGA